MKDLFDYKRIYIWGAGSYGRSCDGLLRQVGIKAEAFIDSFPNKTGSVANGLPVWHYTELKKSQNGKDKRPLIIISVLKHDEEIRNLIEKEDIDKYADICSYIDAINWISATKNDKFVDKVSNNRFAPISILYDHQIFSEQKYGGISRYFYEIISNIIKYVDVKVSLFEGVYQNRFLFDDQIKGFGEFYGRPMDETATYGSLLYTLNNALMKECTKNSHYRIYHPTNYNDTELRNYDFLVVTVHDLIHEVFDISKDFIDVKKKMIERSDFIVAVSESTKNDLVRIYDYPENRIKVIYHANSLHIPCGSERIVEQPYLLYVGEKSLYKNADRLIRAFAHIKQVKDVKLVFFGGSDFSNSEKEYIRKLGVEDRVLHISGGDDTLANLYTYSEIFIYPSLYEGFGIPILEAMHYGTPVITSNTSSMPEVAGNAAYYIDPEDESSILAGIETMLESEDLRKDYTLRGLEREKQFSWEKSVRQLHDLYKELVLQ